LIEDRAAIVRWIFERCDEGWSCDRVARALNENRTPRWGKALYWHSSYIRKILSNGAAVGTLAMHRSSEDETTGARRDKLEGTVEGYFPAAVEREVFDRVNARAQTLAARGRNADKPVRSLVAGVAKCSACEGSMIRVSKGEYVYLLCARAHMRAGCQYISLPYRYVEQAIRRSADELFQDAPRGGDTSEVEQEIGELEHRLEELRDQVSNLADDYRSTGSPAVRRVLQEAERDAERALKGLEAARGRRDRLGSPHALKRGKALRDALVRPAFNISEANMALRASVERIVVYAEARKLDVHWRDSNTVTPVEIPGGDKVKRDVFDVA
jgi:hypothetical protein